MRFRSAKISRRIWRRKEKHSYKQKGSNLIVKTSAKKTLKSSHKNWEKKRKTLLQTKRLKHDHVNLSKKTLKSSHINAARD